MKEFIVKDNEQQRLIKLLGKILSNADNGFIYKMLRKKNIVLNDKKASGNENLKTGDVIKIYFSDETFEKLSGRNSCVNDVNITKGAKDNGFVFKDSIIFENEHVIFVNKPVGILSQKAVKEDVSIVEYLTQYLLNEGKISKDELMTFKPAICNRLDRNTSGIILCGKSLLGLRILNDTISKREIDKFYLTVVNGVVKKSIKSEAFLYKNEKTNKVTVFNSVNEARSILNEREVSKLQTIKTGIRPLISTNKHTLLEIELITGKTHQIRATMAHLGFPVYGDEKYRGDNSGKKVTAKTNNSYVDSMGNVHRSYQFLHAYKIVFKGRCESIGLNNEVYRAHPPKVFIDIIKKLEFKEELLWDIIKEED